jgi:hypothetical protein
MPLEILEKQVKRWIEAEKKASWGIKWGMIYVFQKK